jgi:hypothetical protein
VLFLQEVRDPLAYLTLRFELDRRYTAEEIGHFRLFCSMYLKEPKHKILSLVFGSSDKSNRMRQDSATDFTEQRTGVKYGVSGGQWEQHVEIEDDNHEAVEEEVERYTYVGSSSSVGQDSVEFLNVTYSKNSFIRFSPVLTLYDLDEAMFLPFCNESLATKVSSIHVFSNGYKLQEIRHSEFSIDRTEFDPNWPVEFSAEELQDPWVRLRPADLSSAFHLRFFESTPMRLSTPEPVRSGLDASKGPAHNNAMQPTGEDASG